jgi:hypothetical protein
VWKGRAGERAYGGTQKNLTRHTPQALGAGVMPSPLTWPPARARRPACVAPAGAAGRARHTVPPRLARQGLACERRSPPPPSCGCERTSPCWLRSGGGAATRTRAALRHYQGAPGVTQAFLLVACQRPPARASRWRGALRPTPWPSVCPGGRADPRRGHQREQGGKGGRTRAGGTA